MVRRIHRMKRSLACGLALAFAVVFAATCLVGNELTAAQQACCVAMNHDCGAMADKQDCCSTETPSVAGFSASPIFQLAAPAILAVNIALNDGLPPITSLYTPVGIHPGPPKLSSSPTYLFVSVFRI
jgi:hypothetical protein